MACLYADENVPLPVVRALRDLGHDVVTMEDVGLAGRAIADSEVLRLASQVGRAVLTLNRKDFIRLHEQRPEHGGIIVCTVDRDFTGQAQRIDEEISKLPDLRRQLLRVVRPNA